MNCNDIISVCVCVIVRGNGLYNVCRIIIINKSTEKEFSTET